MATDLTTTDELAAVRTTFRAGAADKLRAVADMSLHDLVDEFVRLSDVIDADTTLIGDGNYPSRKLGPDARLAVRNRNIVLGAARSRFGISFDTYDRTEPSDDI